MCLYVYILDIACWQSLTFLLAVLLNLFPQGCNAPGKPDSSASLAYLALVPVVAGLCATNYLFRGNRIDLGASAHVSRRDPESDDGSRAKPIS